MEKQIVFKNVVFKYVSNDVKVVAPRAVSTKCRVIYLEEEDTAPNDNTLYQFKLCDKATKTKVSTLRETIKSYCKDKSDNSNSEYDFNMPITGDSKTYFFSVKKKWLESTDFVNKEYYQGDLELRFYSMDCPRFDRWTLMNIINQKEGYYAKLSNIKHVDIED